MHTRADDESNFSLKLPMAGFENVYGIYSRPKLVHPRADHYVVDIFHQFNKQWSWKTEFFYKKLWNLIGWDFDKSTAANNTTGKAYGAELLIKKEFSHQISGWLSVTASKTELNNTFFNKTRPSDYDQPLIATLLINKRFNNNWHLNIKWYFHTGEVYTPVIDGIPVTDEETDQILFYREKFGANNSARLPNYHQLDIRIAKQMRFGGWEMDPFFEIINAYNRENVKEYDYSFDKKSKIPTYHLPIFPSFGINVTF